MTTDRRRTLAKLCAAIIVAFVITVCPQAVADDVLNPKTYTSPSGQYELFVDPSVMDGSGPANYRLSRDGEEIWAGKRPFSLWEARVTDSGTVAGYAYEGGVMGGNHGARYSGLSIIILAPDGRELLHDPASSHDGQVSKNAWAGSDSPSVQGILVDPDGDRFVVRIPLNGNEPPVTWWIYRTSTGEKIGDIVPDHPENGGRGFQRDVFAEFLPGTSLTLVHFYIYRYSADMKSDGAVLSLLDPDGNKVWSFDLPGEYDDLGENWSWYWDMVEPGIVQASVGPRSFRFRSYSLSSQLSFSIEADNEAESGWRVVETDRVEDNLPVGREAVARPDIELIKLEHVGAIELQTPKGKPSPIGDISDFAIDRAGNLGFVKRDGNGTVRFVRVDAAGKVLSNFLLDLPQEDQTWLPRVAPVSTDRWVLVRSSLAEGASATAWWIDPATGTIERIKGLASGSIGSVTPTGDGGFITLAGSDQSLSKDKVNRYDSDGRPIWKKQQSGYIRTFGCRAATWLEGVGAAALTGVSNTIEFFDVDGQHQRSVELSDILGKEPNYPTGLRSDLDGGLILHDFSSWPSIYRIDADGKVSATFRPRFPDGRLFRISGDVQVAPDGTLWTSDRHSLLRLNNEGVVDKVIGPQPEDDDLEKIRALAVDSKGHIYVVNERTSAVHVFDSNGRPLQVYKPLPSDFATDGGFGSITIDGDDNIYYNTGGYIGGNSRNSYLRFSAEGERIGFERLGIDWITEEWLFKPNTRERWVLGYKAIHLVDADGKVTKTIRRRPNRNWLQNVQNGAVAPDGSLAVIASPTGRGSRGPAVLSIYDAEGGPIRTIPLAEESIFARVAFNGSTVVTTDGGAVYLYDVSGGAPRKFVLPAVDSKETWWYPHMSPDGTEIWLRGSESMTLLRYKLS